MTDQNSKKDKNNKKAEDIEIKKDDTVLLKEKIEELENQNKRVLADYKNLEKRVDGERRHWILEANKRLLLNILPVLDTLVLAGKHSKSDQNLTLSIKQFLDIITLEGVERIKTQGENFDPHLMECIETVEGEEGKVMEELRAGFILYDKILRPAQVAVGKGLMSSLRAPRV